MRVTSLFFRAARASATARYVFPVPAGPIAKPNHYQELWTPFLPDVDFSALWIHAFLQELLY